MHLDGGYTRVGLMRFGGTWDIPTAAIPNHLRAIGSELLVVTPRFTPEDHDTVEEIRQVRDQVEVCPLTLDAEFTEW